MKYSAFSWTFFVILATTLFLFTGCNDEIVTPASNDCQCPTVETGIIVINPAPDDLNAPWTLARNDTLLWTSNGDSTLTDLAPGTYTVTWGSIYDWISPPSETMTLAAGASLMFSGVYLEPQMGTIVYVSPDGTGDFPTIQAAVDGALPMSTIILTDGIFMGEGNRNILIQNKLLSIISENGPGYTTLDCEYEARAFKVIDVPFFWLEGITVRHGFPVISSGYGSGGGVYVEQCDATVTNCRFENSRASAGSGLYCKNNGKLRVHDCDFTNNSAATGGAAAASTGGTLQLFNCNLFNNRANRAGAVFSQGTELTVSGCFFRQNEATHAEVGKGGAICVENSGSVNISSSVFALNSAKFSGGGLYSESSSVYLRSCTFWLNQGPVGDAGGITFLLPGHLSISESIITASGSGAAVFSDTKVYPWCCDFFDNEGGDWVGCVAGADTLDMGNISLDPMFCNTIHSNFSLQDESPCNGEGMCNVMGAMPVGCD